MLNERSGFSMVEFLFISGILGILFAIGMPAYNTYKARAAQAEAKAHLSLMAEAEKNFVLQHASYTACLRQAGFVPQGLGPFYYSAGFLATDPASNCGRDGNGFCGRYSWTEFGAVCSIAVDTAVQAGIGMHGFEFGADQVPELSKVSKTTFEIRAGADVGNGPFFDEWSIDQDLALMNKTSGL